MSIPTTITCHDLLSFQEPIVAIIRIGAMGDIVASEPVLKFVADEYSNAKIVWLLRNEYIELLNSHPLLDYIMPVEHLEQANNIANALSSQGNTVINFHFARQLCRETGNIIYNNNDKSISGSTYYNYGSLLESFCLSAKISKLSNAPHFYISKDINMPNLPKKFIIFHCLSRDDSRNWRPVNWKKLLYFFIKNKINVIEIGLRPLLHSSNPYYHDFTYEHSLQTLAAIISRADFFFGIDSGFAHIANALCVNGIIIMGRFNNFINHIPYTGMYSKGHIVRLNDGPAKDVPVDLVINHYNLINHINN